MLYVTSSRSLSPLLRQWVGFWVIHRLNWWAMRAYRWLLNWGRVRTYTFHSWGWARKAGSEIAFAVGMTQDCMYSSMVSLWFHVWTLSVCLDIRPRPHYHPCPEPFGQLYPSGYRFAELRWPTPKLSCSVWGVLGHVWFRVLSREQRAKIRSERR
jgi:hypothetical protein